MNHELFCNYKSAVFVCIFRIGGQAGGSYSRLAVELITFLSNEIYNYLQPANRRFPQIQLCINASFQTNQENLFCKEFQGSVPVIFHTFINKNCGLVPKSRNLQIVVNTWYNFAHKQCNCLLGQQAAALSVISVQSTKKTKQERE